MAQVVKLEPGDVLVFANVGEAVVEELNEELCLLGRLRERFGLAEILVFEGDVDLSKIPRDAS